MKILDRYLAKNFVLPLAYCLSLFCLLYIIVDIFGHLDEILQNKVPIGILIEYYVSFLPLIFVQTTPVATLLSIVYMLGTLNKNNELTAIKACGISVGHLLLPIFTIGIILSLSVFLINEKVVTKTVSTTNRIKEDYIETSPEKRGNMKVLRDLTVYGKERQILYAKMFNPIDNTLSGIVILEEDTSQKLRRKIIAQKGVWVDRKWTFFDVIIYRFDKAGEPVTNALVFKKKIINFPDTPQDLLRQKSQTSYMGYNQLKDYILRLSGENSKTICKLKTELHFKTALPLVCLVIMLLGIPFALITTRGGAMAGIGLSVMVGLLYYSSIYFSLALGRGEFLPPIVAAHLPNAAFFFMAIYFIKRSRF